MSRFLTLRNGYDAFGWAVLAATAGLTLAIVAGGERERWISLVYDDGYYYLGLVRGVVDHGVSSFLPPFESNGYQPLWLVVLALVAGISGTGDTALVGQTLAVSFVFIALFAFAVQRLHGAAWPALWLALIYDMVMFRGMETAMLPLWAVLFMATRRDAWGLRGVLASAIFLTRLDALSLIVARDLYHLVIRRDPWSSFRHWLIVLPVIAAYAGFSLWHFGVPVPVSGLSKAVGNVPLENVFPLVAYASVSVKPLLALCGLVVLSLWWLKRPLVYVREFVVCGVALAVCAAYYTAMSGWMLWSWYYWPTLLLALYVLLEAIAIFGEAAVKVQLVVVALGMVALDFGHAIWPFERVRELVRGLPGSALPIRDNGYQGQNLALAARIREGLIPAGSMIAMGDRAGGLGFLLGFDSRFLHTEGLVASVDYYHAMQADQGREYLLAQSPDYYVADRQTIFADADTLGFAEPVQGISSHTGPYLLCFARTGMVDARSYGKQTRYLMDFRALTDCPAAFTERFAMLRSRCNGVREFSLPAEYGKPTLRWVKRRCDAIPD